MSGGFDRPREDRVFSNTLTSDPINGDITGPAALTTTTGNGLAFTNQPGADGIEVLSSSAADTTQTITLIAAANGSDTVITEGLALNGTSVVLTSDPDWGKLMAVQLSAACVGTVTVRRAADNATIVTLAPGVLTNGIELVAAENQQAWNRTVSLVASGTTTKQVGFKGVNSTGATIYDSQALTGTTSVLSNSAFVLVTEIYTGDLEANRTVTETATDGVKLDGGFIYREGGLDVAVADGGTDASTRTGAQTNLGLLASRVSTQFDKTNATLANVTGLSVPVLAGVSYKFTCELFIELDAVDGGQIAISGTATVSNIIARVDVSDPDATSTVIALSRIVTLNAAFSVNSDGGTVTISGLFTVANAGNITVQFAKSTAINGNASSILVGSTLTAQENA